MSVYFARVKDYVKIGFSADPCSRVNTITSGTCLRPVDVSYGDKVHLLGWVRGDRKVEREMHRRFAALRVNGEWFWDDDEYDALIEADPFGINPNEMSLLAIKLVEEHDVPRDLAIEAANKTQAEQFEKSGFARLGFTLGEGERLRDWYRDMQATDRAYWREQRKAVA